MRDHANSLFHYLFPGFHVVIAPSTLTFKAKLAVYLKHSHNDGALAPFEFDICVFPEVNGALFIAAIQ